MHTIHKLVVPVSIIVAGALIAGAIYLTNSKPANVGAKVGVADIAKNAQGAPEVEIAPVTEVDHIQGDASKAKVTIVEYSDTECPFCKRHHQTLSKIFSEYGKAGKIAWVYRHFPLDFHTKAPKEAEATECANELGGAKAFWDYIGTVYENTPSNDGLDLAKLPEFAEQVGLDKAAFVKCLDSGKYKAKITEAKNAGLKAGARGTPYTVLLVKDGSKVQTVPLVNDQGSSLGALPYESMKAVLDSFLK
ncbi:MAG: DsbA family protein [Candidatus Pacebacteria bacterium]|nr:DsbA family protein [Candidatus Paceibacterota bacterium]